MTRVLATYPVHCSGRGPTHIFLSLCLPKLSVPLQIEAVVPSCEPAYRCSNLIEALPNAPARQSAARSKRIRQWVRQWTEWRFRRELERADAAYIWPAVSIPSLRAARDHGKTTFIERINCFAGKSKAILDDAYGRLDRSQRFVSAETVEDEREQAHLADYIFCPSPHVQASYAEIGIPKDRLLLSSYGWSPERFPHLTPPHPPEGRRSLTVLFVGFACVRKGAHLLIEAFARSRIEGKLVLCGRLERAVAEVCAEWLAHPNIIHHPYTDDVSSFYRAADVFAFPSLEEGSPLVSYEAMAHGLPMVVSPMGAGDVVRSGVEGVVLPPYDMEAWVETLRELAADPDLRYRYACNSWQRAQAFTFNRVAERRAQMMLDRLSARAA